MPDAPISSGPDDGPDTDPASGADDGADARTDTGAAADTDRDTDAFRRAAQASLDGAGQAALIQPRHDLIVCPTCDAAWQARTPHYGERAVCTRCHTVLIAPRRKAGLQIIAVALAVVILIVNAVFHPFLTVSVAGARNSVSIIDAAVAFGNGPLAFLSLATVAVIVFIPLTRVLLLLYVLVPVVRDRPPARHAKRAFRLSETLRPWSMAEIFAIGCAVALIKIADLAMVQMGPAFWMFAILVVLVVVQDNFMCKWSVWNALDQRKES